VPGQRCKAGTSKIQSKKDKGEAIPVLAWTGPEVSRKLMLPDFMTIGT